MAPDKILVKLHWVNFLILWCAVSGAATKCAPEWCGSSNLSYPFWIQNPSCAYPGFQIKCKEDTLFLPTLVRDFEILRMNYSGYIIINSTSLKAMSCEGTYNTSVVFSLPTKGPFTISDLNRFAVVGCKSMGSFTDNTSTVQVRCESACLHQYDPTYCNGYSCYEVGIPGNQKFIKFTGGGAEQGNSSSAGVCGFSTILEPSTFRVQKKDRGVFARGRYGLRLEWGVGHENCSNAIGTSCAEEAECKDSTTAEGHICTCRHGYKGDGYSHGTGCTDVNECNLQNDCDKENGICQNLPGSYNCSCPMGYEGNGFHSGYYSQSGDVFQPGTRWMAYFGNGSRSGYYSQSGDGFQGTGCNRPFISKFNVRLWFPRQVEYHLEAAIGVVSSVGVSLAACALFCCFRRRQKKQLRAKYFQQNGGIQLQQYIAPRGGKATLKIYSAIELEKASKNYSPDMKLGSGGYGTVFKAIFPDSIIGAIKKSKEILDPQKEEDNQFINELIILSQINHRNVVKLVGCCLETRNPLLVYEFVPNGTLREHIHSKECLSWDIRQRIAIETAEALAYLHSAASPP